MVQAVKWVADSRTATNTKAGHRVAWWRPAFAVYSGPRFPQPLGDPRYSTSRLLSPSCAQRLAASMLPRVY